jgi:hypothetical protein
VIGSAWLETLGRVLRPARPYLGRCLEAREAYSAERRGRARVQLRALATCEERIGDARARVFAAADGIVGRRMTELEREWLRLSSPDPEAGLMELWARLAPPSWLDRKRFRGGSEASMLDALVALASDPDGVEAAEHAAGALRAVLAPHGVTLGSKVGWRALGADEPCWSALLAAPLRAAGDACASKIRARVFERAADVAADVAARVVVRHAGRAQLAADVGATACLDVVWQAAALPEGENPAAPLRALLRTGYVLAAADAASVTLAFPAV